MSEKTTDNKCPNCGRITNTILTIKGKSYCLDCADATMMELLKSASFALRSYQHGNCYSDLAEEVADKIDALLKEGE